MLNKTQAEKLFAENAVLFCSEDAVPLYKMRQIFSPEIVRHIFVNGEPGRDHNAIGCNDLLPDLVSYATKTGFLRAVAYQNALECAEIERSAT